jgi:glucose uptake protein
MLATLYAFITVLAWGIWLAPSQNISFRNQQIKTFYVGAANLALATLVFLFQGFQGLTWEVFWLPFIGGLVWAVSGLMAFTATDRLGMARAYGLWAPVNVGVSIFWGAVIFDEFIALRPVTLLVLALSLVIIIAGILLIIFAKGFGAQSQSRRAFWTGLLGGLGAGVLWGTYFIPIKLSAASLWVASFPLAVGIFAGSTLLVAITRQPLSLGRTSDYARVSTTGVLWGIGNFAMLLLVEQIGAGRGFTISQLGIVVNGLIGVYLLKDPQPKSRAANLTLIGCFLATIGGILLGNLR